MNSCVATGTDGTPKLSNRIVSCKLAPGLQTHGVPHPVNYLVAADGMLVRKYFVPNYQHRVTASSVALREFGAIVEGTAALTLRSGAFAAEIGLSAAKAFAGQQIGFFAKFRLDRGWHVCGAPLPTAYTTRPSRCPRYGL
jgi:hypothetical protein